jgi:hypothetical protein
MMDTCLIILSHKPQYLITTLFQCLGLNLNSRGIVSRIIIETFQLELFVAM